MAVCRVKLKFKGDMNADLKEVLKSHGFVYYSGHPDWLIYIKTEMTDRLPKKRAARQAANAEPLSEAKEAELNRRCDHVVSLFKGDLTKHKLSIKTRLGNIAKTLVPAERAYVEGWIKRVVDEDEEVEVH